VVAGGKDRSNLVGGRRNGIGAGGLRQNPGNLVGVLRAQVYLVVKGIRKMLSALPKPPPTEFKTPTMVKGTLVMRMVCPTSPVVVLKDW
jgi:hypothetical protein